MREMKWYTHLTCITLVLATLSRFFPLTLGFILFSLLGSLLPDLLESWLGLPHRSRYIHNFAIGALLIPLSIFSEWLLALGVGYLHHLVLDATTVTGSYICNHRVRGPLRTSSLAHNVVIVLAHMLLLLALV